MGFCKVLDLSFPAHEQEGRRLAPLLTSSECSKHSDSSLIVLVLAVLIVLAILVVLLIVLIIVLAVLAVLAVAGIASAVVVLVIVVILIVVGHYISLLLIVSYRNSISGQQSNYTCVIRKFFH